MAGQGSSPNLMQTNQSLLSGMQLFSGTVAPQSAQSQQQIGLGMNVMQPMSSGLPSTGYPAPTGTTASSVTSNLNQQFGNLNIGNVWQ